VSGVSIGKIITADFETEADGRPHQIPESWIERVEPRFRSRISAGFQCRAGFGDCLGEIVGESRRTKRSKCLFDPGATFGDRIAAGAVSNLVPAELRTLVSLCLIAMLSMIVSAFSKTRPQKMIPTVAAATVLAMCVIYGWRRVCTMAAKALGST
jgi:hypothetical protein